MTKYEGRSFAATLISGSVEPFALERRNDRHADPRPAHTGAHQFVVMAVVAFVVGFLSLFAFAASRQAPESFVKDTSLMTMYGP